MKKLKFREDESPSQSCTAPVWTVDLGSPSDYRGSFMHTPTANTLPLLQVPVPGCLPARPGDTVLLFLLSTLHQSSREGGLRKAAHVRKFQPREQARAKDSGQPKALGETETGCAGGGVVTGDLKSHHFLELPEGTGRAKLLREHAGPD